MAQIPRKHDHAEVEKEVPLVETLEVVGDAITDDPGTEITVAPAAEDSSSSKPVNRTRRTVPCAPPPHAHRKRDRSASQRTRRSRRRLWPCSLV